MPCHGGWPTKHMHGILDPWKHGLVVYQYLQSKSCVFCWVVPGFGMIWPIKKLTSYGVHIGLICKVGDSITENMKIFNGDVINKKIGGPETSETLQQVHRAIKRHPLVQESHLAIWSMPCHSLPFYFPWLAAWTSYIFTNDPIFPIINVDFRTHRT